MNMQTPILAYGFSSARDEVTAAYIGNSVQRWNIETGAMKIVKQAAFKEEAIDHVAGLQNDISVIGRPSGQIQIYSDAGGAAQPAGTVKFEPLGYLGELGPAQAFLVTKTGAAALLDVSTPSEPKIEMLPAMGKCAGKVAIPGFAICLSADGHMHVWRDADATLAADWPAPPEGIAAAFMTDDGARMAIGDKAGHIIVRAVSDGSVLTNLTLARAGQPAVAAHSVVLTQDDVHLAVAMPKGPIKLFNLKTGAARDVRLYGRNSVAEQLLFSPHGQLLAAVETSDFRVLTIYNVEDGARLAAISLSNQANPKLYVLDDGRGFVTIDTGGRIVVHPVFEKSQDFMAYLAKEFPDQLTPAQKRFYFIN